MDLSDLISGAIMVACLVYGIYVVALRPVGKEVSFGKLARALGIEMKDEDLLQGVFEGRPIRLERGEDRTIEIFLAVERPPPLAIHRDGLAALLDRAFGAAVRSGDRAFDGRFAVRSTEDRARARAALGDDFKEVVRRLFDRFDVTRVDTTLKPTLYKDTHLFGDKAILRARVASLPGGDPLPLVRELVKLAAILEGVPLHVISLGGERRAERTSAGSPRCAWCHADITGAEPDLVACEKCSTVLHEGCWAEQGGCPVMGCGSKQAERARTT